MLKIWAGGWAEEAAGPKIVKTVLLKKLSENQMPWEMYISVPDSASGCKLKTRCESAVSNKQTSQY